jgi:hypothetical protein
MKQLLFILVITIGIGASYSCYKDPGAGAGIITVVDNNDFKVPSATVKLSQPGQNNTGFIINEGLTDQSGEYSYTHQDFQVDFGTEVILNVSASEGGRVGSTIIHIRPDETTRETVTIL